VATGGAAAARRRSSPIVEAEVAPKYSASVAARLFGQHALEEPTVERLVVDQHAVEIEKDRGSTAR
jgi:hypothetical protein